MCDTQWETALGEAPRQDNGQGKSVDDEHRGRSETGVVPVDAADVDSSQR